MCFITGRSSQCRIPKLDINGTEVIKFFHDPPPLNCSKGKDENWFYVDSERRFRITESATKEHGNISCFISPIYRISDEKISIGTPSNIATYGLLEGSDFAEVNCTAADRETRRGLLLTVLPKTKRVEQLRAIRKPSDWSGLDVFFLGFDSLSQMSFRRKLPRTTRFLEEKLNAVILNGYNIVGDGTPQAFIPILTSQTEQELPLTRKRFENANYVDVYPFIWRNFSDSGYITLYAEDMARFGIFSYRLKGFNKQPTDHYIRPFIQRLEGAYKSPKCVGSEPMHKQWFRYAGEFMKRYDRKVPKFLLAFHGVLSHDDINLVQVADEDLAQYLQEMLASSALNNSLIIVMADHGHRFAQLRSTHQGQLEERLPFFAVALPKWFRQSERGRTAWLNLQNNKNRLATPFDIHSTLIDVLHWPSQKELLKEGNIHKRSISLFRRIPLARSCAQAGIEPHWCTCLEWKSAMNAEQRKISTALAEMVVKAINEHTESERSMCAELRLKEILDSKRLVPHAKLLEYSGANDTDGFMPKFDGKTKAAFAYYQMKFVTIPGNAIYEVWFNVFGCGKHKSDITLPTSSSRPLNTNIEKEQKNNIAMPSTTEPVMQKVSSALVENQQSCFL
ncbi:unnamed protein product [Toxocara canis]|uniref:DUF229 domain-containing protein n=1 Tax=Toxocara canis TaxID=6265 RepID=A0A183UWN8_TOXCA|nr:unnamed protein product [Toxocara canis]